jgi:hypothetical protein
MKLEQILNYVNSFEKNPFLKVIDNIISNNPKKHKEVDRILNELDGQIKNADNNSVAQILNLVEEEFADHIEEEFLNTTTQLDILIDIIIRDGNSLMKREWLGKLYEKEIQKIKKRITSFEKNFDEEDKDLRNRDYVVYKNCLETAYKNDREFNQESKITRDEQSILNTLASSLELSHEEIKLMNYLIVPLQKIDIDEIIKYLSSTGVIFYSRKNHQVYVADEVIRILRKIRGKDVSEKIFRKVLKKLKDSNINQLARKHGIDRKLSREEKIKEILNEGITLKSALRNGIFRDDVNKTDRKATVKELIEKRLRIDEKIKGASLEAKIENLITYFKNRERDGSLTISVNGYEKLLKDVKSHIPKLNSIVREEFEFQEEDALKAKFLLTHNIRPSDIIYLLTDDEVKDFCNSQSISIRGNEIQNILDEYRDVENLFIENYELIARRDFNSLQENGLDVKEAEIGVKFEEVTKSILKKLGFNVDDDLRNSVNTSKDKADIILNEGQGSLIIIECKSIKEKGYNKYSSVARQVKSYKNNAEKKGYEVMKIFIVAPEFTDEFINDCSLDYESNLSLITADTLIEIYNVFKEFGHKSLPISLLMRDVLIDKERVLKSLEK